jgi:hypothetical protein
LSVERCVGTVRGRPGKHFKSGAKRGDKFANNTNNYGWKTLERRSLIARICALYKAYTGRRAWKAIRDSLLKPCYLCKDDKNGKLGLGKKKSVGKYSFVNRTIKSWNQLPAGLLASFPCKLNLFRKRVKNVAISKGIQVVNECK